VLIYKVVLSTKALCREDFFTDSKTFDAVIRNLQIRVEAAKKLPPEIKRKCKAVEWKKLLVFVTSLFAITSVLTKISCGM
jgi:uncharacterized protein with HEPN domain